MAEIQWFFAGSVRAGRTPVAVHLDVMRTGHRVKNVCVLPGLVVASSLDASRFGALVGIR